MPQEEFLVPAAASGFYMFLWLALDQIAPKLPLLV